MFRPIYSFIEKNVFDKLTILGYKKNRAIRNIKAFFFPKNVITFKTIPKTYFDFGDYVLNINFELFEKFYDEYVSIIDLNTIDKDIQDLYTWWIERKSKLDEIEYPTKNEDIEKLQKLMSIKDKLWI